MLFLLNAVVVKVPEVVELPPGLASRASAPARAVLDAGGEIYARHPRLEHERPDIAESYCSLLMSRFPPANGALFEPGPAGYAGRLAEITFPLLARLYGQQRDGLSIEAEARHTIWRPADALPAGRG